MAGFGELRIDGCKQRRCEWLERPWQGPHHEGPWMPYLEFQLVLEAIASCRRSISRTVAVFKKSIEFSKTTIL